MKKDFCSKKEITLFAEKASGFILVGNVDAAFQIIKPNLDGKRSFPMLDFLGRKIGEASISQPQRFLVIINCKTMVGFVIVGQALIPLLEKRV